MPVTYFTARRSSRIVCGSPRGAKSHFTKLALARTGLRDCAAESTVDCAAKHIGGNGAPDGYADAQLGTLGYRVMIECKSGKAIHTARIFEAAKYKDTYSAQ